MIEKSEKRRRRMVITVLVVLTLVIVGGAVALWWFFSNDLGARPAAKSYGTALYDNTAESYLTKGTEKLPGVVGYLGFPVWRAALSTRRILPLPKTLTAKLPRPASPQPAR
ncbi:MAG: hypothetical protein EP147_00755 [Subdoligranulum sp.]|nr:hypothetical protein [Subdoligranulum sp.]